MPSPTKASSFFSGFWASSFSTYATLSAGSSPACTSSMPRSLCHLLGHSGGVAGQHDGLRTPCAFRPCMAGPGGGLYLIGNQDGATAYWPSRGHIDNRACALGGGVGSMLAAPSGGRCRQPRCGHPPAPSRRDPRSPARRDARSASRPGRRPRCRLLLMGWFEKLSASAAHLEQVGLGHAVGGGGVA